MTTLSIDIPIKNIVKLITSMNKQEVETLYLLLTEDGEELLERKKDVLSNNVRLLNRDEAFDV
ncbi:hypothetical protein QUF74_18415 [Candidatus Halobeggiatoa sp. HSG11]|nr:hypothetical protein [Candidatus Halobeggiatoa sp. HSG11]